MLVVCLRVRDRKEQGVGRDRMLEGCVSDSLRGARVEKIFQVLTA